MIKMIKYFKDDPVKLISFIIAIALCLIVLRRMCVLGKRDSEEFREIFRNAFIEGAEESISEGVGRNIRLSDDGREYLKELFDRNINVSNITRLLNRNPDFLINEDNVSEVNDMITGLFSERDRIYYREFIDKAIKTADKKEGYQ